MSLGNPPHSPLALQLSEGNSRLIRGESPTGGRWWLNAIVSLWPEPVLGIPSACSTRGPSRVQRSLNTPKPGSGPSDLRCCVFQSLDFIFQEVHRPVGSKDRQPPGALGALLVWHSHGALTRQEEQVGAEGCHKHSLLEPTRQCRTAETHVENVAS